MEREKLSNADIEVIDIDIEIQIQNMCADIDVEDIAYLKKESDKKSTFYLHKAQVS